RRAHHAERLDGPLHDEQRVGLGGLLLRLRQSLGVALGVAELERVDRQHFRADLEAAVRVEQRVQARARAEALVVAALGANVQVLFQVGAVEHRVAGLTLGPQALGHGLALRAGGALDLGRQQLLQPAHASSAFLMGARKFFTRATACAGSPASISWMMRLPIPTASAVWAMRLADSASRMPKPTPIGSLVAARIFGMRVPISPRSRCAAPVTPRRDT